MINLKIQPLSHGIDIYKLFGQLEIDPPKYPNEVAVSLEKVHTEVSHSSLFNFNQCEVSRIAFYGFNEWWQCWKNVVALKSRMKLDHTHERETIMSLQE